MMNLIYTYQPLFDYFLLAVGFGLALGLVIGWSRTIYAGIYPLMIGFNAMVGAGWIEGWYADAVSPERWPAPRIEAPDAPITAASLIVSGLLLGAALLLGWHGDSIHENGGHHLERNQDYQTLLRLHVQAAQALQAEHPRAVLCAFPMTSILTSQPSDGYLPAPVPARYVPGEAPLAELCQFDFLVEADGGSVQRSKQRLLDAGALTLWKRIGDAKNLVGARTATPRWARADHQIRIYRVACPARK